MSFTCPSVRMKRNGLTSPSTITLDLSWSGRARNARSLIFAPLLHRRVLFHAPHEVGVDDQCFKVPGLRQRVENTRPKHPSGHRRKRVMTLFNLHNSFRRSRHGAPGERPKTASTKKRLSSPDAPVRPTSRYKLRSPPLPVVSSRRIKIASISCDLNPFEKAPTGESPSVNRT